MRSDSAHCGWLQKGTFVPQSIHRKSTMNNVKSGLLAYIAFSYDRAAPITALHIAFPAQAFPAVASVAIGRSRRENFHTVAVPVRVLRSTGH